MKNYKIKLNCVYFDECDPKKCTALKLKKLGMIKTKPRISKQDKSVVLSPFSPKIISEEDRQLVLKFGLTVIDCSWKNINKFSSYSFNNSRKLPPLIAANPTNYGKWGKLSTVEALAAALYLINYSELARLLLSKFSWGPVFEQINDLK